MATVKKGKGFTRIWRHFHHRKCLRKSGWVAPGGGWEEEGTPAEDLLSPFISLGPAGLGCT